MRRPIFCPSARLSLLCFLAFLSGCLGSEDSAQRAPAAGGGNGAANAAPVISGNPRNAVRIGDSYRFIPVASDADGDRLSFSVNKVGTVCPSARLSLLCFLAFLSGCLGSEDSAQRAPAAGGGNGAANAAPVISGNPRNAVRIGDSYRFIPVASDADGDRLSFSVNNLPRWALFDPTTGEVFGQPLLGDVAGYAGISIRVSDGIDSSALAPFSIDVVQAALGSVTLSWTPPTENDDGSPLLNLAGYNIYYGVSRGNYPNRINIDNPGIAIYVVDNLTPGSYYFVASAINDIGVESNFSNEIEKMVN